MTDLDRLRQRVETVVDRWRGHPDRIPVAEACQQVLAALDEPLDDTTTTGDRA